MPGAEQHRSHREGARGGYSADCDSGICRPRLPFHGMG
jgi:hypothetical protein